MNFEKKEGRATALENAVAMDDVRFGKFARQRRGICVCPRLNLHRLSYSLLCVKLRTPVSKPERTMNKTKRNAMAISPLLMEWVIEALFLMYHLLL